MHTSTILASTLSLLALSTASPISPRQSGPKINVTFFSTPDCSIGFPSTTHHTTIYAGPGVSKFSCDSYSSLIINEIDDQFIGSNSALQVGNTGSATVDFTKAIKFNISTKDQVRKCQFIGIPHSTPGKPLLSGNEYRLTTLQG